MLIPIRDQDAADLQVLGLDGPREVHEHDGHVLAQLGRGDPEVNLLNREMLERVADLLHGGVADRGARDPELQFGQLFSGAGAEPVDQQGGGAFVEVGAFKRTS